MRTLRILAAVGATGLGISIAACSGDKTDNIYVVVNDAGANLADGSAVTATGSAAAAPLPNGAVSGILYDGSSLKGLSGVAVTVTINDKSYTGMTDMNGLYTIANVPASTVWVQYSLAGYADAFFSASPTTTTVSNFGVVSDPITQINPIGLVKTTGTFALALLTDTGAPAAGVTARLRQPVRYLSYNSGNAASPAGLWDVTATSGADGILHFTNMVDLTSFDINNTQSGFSIDISPTTIGAGTTAYPFLGIVGLSYSTVQTVNNTGSAGGTPYYVLAGPNTGLAASQSNIDFISSGLSTQVPAVTPVPAAGPLTIGFNEAINASTVHALLLNEDGTPSSITLTPTVATNQLSLAPSSPFVAGAHYNLDLSVEAAYRVGNTNASTRVFSTVAPFFVANTDGSAVSIVSVVNDPASNAGAASGKVLVTFSEPIGYGYNQKYYAGGAGGYYASLLPCVGFYESDLNGVPAIPFGGEWTPAGQTWPLECYSTGAVVSNGTTAYTNGANNMFTDPTQMTSIELNTAYVTGAARIQRTGYSSKWLMQYATLPGNPAGACQNGLSTTTTPACAPPATGTKVHLVFGELPFGGVQVTRATGEPLPDTLTFTLP